VLPDDAMKRPETIGDVLAWIDQRIRVFPMDQVWLTQVGPMMNWCADPKEEQWAQAVTEILFGATYGGPGGSYNMGTSLEYLKQARCYFERALALDPGCIEALIGTASYTDPETGGHFWYPKTSGAERVADGWHVRKTAAFTTSSGFADWYLTQTTSPDFAGDYADLSVFLLYPDEVQGNPGTWDAMGMHANQSAPVEIDAVIPENRIVGWPGDGARSNDEAIDPLAFLQYAGAYNGLAMACLDVARRHALRRAHAQYGRRIADYATSQDAYGRALREAQASRLFAYGLAKALDDATDGGDWTMYRENPDAAPRAAFTSWGLEAKVLAAGLASRVSDAMLQLCGGRGYTRAAEIERLVRDAKAGWVMAPSNEVSQQIVGRWALLGADSVDWWNQKVDERALRNELGKLNDEQKRRLVDELSTELTEAGA